MTRATCWICGLTATALFTLLATNLPAGPAYTDPANADADYPLQGEYVGTVTSEGEQIPLGIQVIALGKGQFRAVAYPGGLPGAGWNGEEKMSAEAGRDGDTVTFVHAEGKAVLSEGKIDVFKGDAQVGTLKRVVRESPTLGMKPPAGAVVLFDGSGVEQWARGRMEDGLLVQGAVSKAKFQDHTVHIEFRLPYQPENRGQGRGNSGFYVHGRYEIQMLDSFGLEGRDNECGGIYSIAAPKVNMCLPPLQWQTYDVDFTAPRFDENGNKTANARVTVRLNGVVIHDDLELPKATPGGVAGNESPEPGPVYLQDHGDPVRYRNIWVLEK